MKIAHDSKIFLILLGLGLISVICVLPYVYTIQGELLRSTGQPLWVLFGMQVVQSAILFAVAIYIGLACARRSGLQLPILDAIASRRDYRSVVKAILLPSVLIGSVTGSVIFATDSLFSMVGVSLSTHQTYAPAWQTLLAAVYGGTAEEILMRLCVMSLCVWIGMKLLNYTVPPRAAIIVSIFLAALVFGLGHLPITAALTTITTMVVLRAIILNGIGGVVFGWLFWKRGFESAMIAHFAADVLLLTVLPFLFV